MRLDDVLAKLEGVRRYGGYFLGRCPAHDDRNPSLRICEGESGKVLIKCYAGCEYRAIIDALSRRPWPAAPGSSSTSRLPTTAHDHAKTTDFALRIWREARRSAGTLVETYLRSRRITIPVPPSLRFHPQLKHPSRIYLPAMVAAVQAPDGRIVAIHRTFLKGDGSGKANVEQQKMMLGPCGGGAVRFARPAPTIAVAEGIETALSISQACPDLAVWAALSASGMCVLRLPEDVREVILCADKDANGVGERAARAAAARFVSEGRKVRIAKPTGANDFNDELTS
jgi:putative DNA primase/helicase